MFRSLLFLLSLVVLSSCTSLLSSNPFELLSDSLKTEVTSETVEGEDPFLDSDGSSEQLNTLTELSSYCPRVQTRSGTGSYRTFTDDVVVETGENSVIGEDIIDENIEHLRYQGTITRIARQCIYRGDELDITVGIRARAITGPSGLSGDAIMPFRVVLRQPECLYLNQVFDSVASFPSGVPITTFRLITDPLTIPSPQQTNVLLYVGFDNPAIETPDLPICKS